MKIYEKWFLVSVCMVLLLTGGIKVWSAVGDVPLLDRVEGVFGVAHRWVYLGSGLLELGVAAGVIGRRKVTLKMGLILSLGMSFAGYRVFRWWMEISEPCSCLGTATEWLGRFERFTEPVMLLLVGYFIVSSAFFLFMRLRRISTRTLDAGVEETRE